MKKLLLLLVLIGVLIGAGLAYFAYARIHEPFRGYSSPDQTVTIPRDMTTRAMGEQLVATGVVRDLPTFRGAVWLSGNARRLQAGEYRFDRAMSAIEVLEKIASGDVVLLAITFREGLTIPEMADVFGASGFGPATDFIKAAQNSSLVKEMDPSATDLEGYLFPDTYTFPRGADARRVVDQMVARFAEVLTPAIRESARARGVSVRELVTLASLVERETARPEERPIVAGVYANRLRIGMPLQCDPTVIYALQREGRYDGNLRRVDLAFDSPYNTYRYPGLPPGPIAAPGKGSLEAASQPAKVDFLYFVSRNDGSHEFASTLTEHNRNVQRYQVEFFRQQRQR